MVLKVNWKNWELHYGYNNACIIVQQLIDGACQVVARLT